ncbi:MAG: hypothetical protein ACRDRH_11390 [Pseudonocardia sp.]
MSGGHTSLFAVGDLARDEIVHLSDAIDDAAGEAFDKVPEPSGSDTRAGRSSTERPATAIWRPSPSSAR